MATAAPIWVSVKHDDTCKCGRALTGGEDRAAYDMEAQEFVSCEACDPSARPEVITAELPPAQSPLAGLVSAVERFARANGAADKVDSMLAALMRAAAK